MTEDLMKVIRAPVAKVERLEDDFEDEYVYDIGVDDATPYFFGNNILLHNSCYYSPYEALKDLPEYAGFDWSIENCIELYDGIADITNESFPAFMMRSFNTSHERGSNVKAGRELLGSTAIFIKKKKYAILMVEKEGHRLDKGGKPGKLKYMGLDMKRSDTPVFMQKFLEKLLMDVLTGAPETKMFDDIRTFRKDFKARPGWEKGSPKKVNALSTFGDAEAAAQQGASKGKIFKKGEKGKINMPGHVRAALNWNILCDLNGDKYSVKIGDGAKCIVVKLKPNVMKMDSVAYPIDQLFLPDWFKQLPYDHAAMEETIIDKKINNLVGVLGWDLTLTKERGGEQFLRFV